VRLTDQIWRWLDEIDRDAVRACLHNHYSLTIRTMVEPYVFSLRR
jgi:hypothetical protein